MQCEPKEYLRRKYPETVELMFLSYSGTPPVNSNIGIFNELELLGTATATPAIRKLALISNDDVVKNRSQIAYLDKVELFAIDVTLTASANQDAGTLAEIYNSKTGNDVYAQSLFKNAYMMAWQPNYCRPQIFINGIDIIPGYQFSNLAYKSIGIPLNRCIDIGREFTNINSIAMESACCQYIVGTAKYQNYPLHAILTFWLGNNAMV
jgi:hypothetical protein